MGGGDRRQFEQEKKAGTPRVARTKSTCGSSRCAPPEEEPGWAVLTGAPSLRSVEAAGCGLERLKEIRDPAIAMARNDLDQNRRAGIETSKPSH